MHVRICVASVLLSAVLFGCWETRRVHDHGEVAGFSIGSSKQETFDQAIRNQHSGLIRNLELMDQPAGTYDEKYKGDPIVAEDFLRVSKSDDWHLGRTECNCWFRLIFRDARLARIEEHEWTGPTE